MKDRIILIALAAIVLLSSVFALSAFMPKKEHGSISNLGIPLISQHAGQWCGAACTEMIIRYYHIKYPNDTTIQPGEQCNLIKKVYGFDSLQCPIDESVPVDPQYDYGINPFSNQGANVMKPFSYAFNQITGGSALYDSVYQSLANGFPVINTWCYVGITHAKLDAPGGTHVLIAEGCPHSAHSDSLWVSVNDPLPVKLGHHSVMLFSEFAAGYVTDQPWKNMKSRYSQQYIFVGGNQLYYNIQPASQMH